MGKNVERINLKIVETDKYCKALLQRKIIDIVSLKSIRNTY